MTDEFAPSALIVNPAATRARRRLLDSVAQTLVPFGLEHVLMTRGPGDARRLAREAIADGARMLVTLGGDGTVGQVAGVACETGTIVAPLPAGGANVFSRALGWPPSPRASAAMLGPALVGEHVRAVTLGLITTPDGQRPFVVNAGIGLDADTVRWVESRPELKSRLRQAAFGLGVSVAARRAVRRTPRLVLSLPGQDPLPAAAVVVAAGSPYTYLGSLPVHLLPPAEFDGRLAWLALLRVTPAELAALAAGSLRGDRRHLDRPAVAAGRTTSLRAVADEPLAVQADGEPLGQHAAIEVAAGPRLRVLVPDSVHGPPLKSAAPAPNPGLRTKDGPR